MGNILEILQEIFMMKEDKSTQIGLSAFKNNTVASEKVTGRTLPPKELKLSELMRRSTCVGE